MVIKLNKAETPNKEIKKTVIKLIGIITPKGIAIRLYPYNKKHAKITFFKILNIFFNILSTSFYYMWTN